MIKRIHVNQHNLKWNRTHDDKRPPISVITYKGTTHGDKIDIQGPSEIIHRPEKPLSCGAHIWVETHACLELFDNDKRIVIK